MAVMIKGIKVKSIDIGRDDKGIPTISGSYQLISNADVVLAEQSFNGYNTIKVVPDEELSKLMHAVVEAVKNSLENVMGLKEVSKYWR